MKKILIIASNYMDLNISSNNRTNFLPQYLHDNGYNVELVTTNFNHHLKKHIYSGVKRDYKITMLPEIGYYKNVSFRRILSIYSYKISLKKYLKNLKGFDYVYVFVPPHSIAKVAYKFAKKIKAKFIIDVRDLWPEAFRLIFKNNLLFNFLFWPLIIQANNTYKCADTIISVSETYRVRAHLGKIDLTNSFVIYLGTSFLLFDTSTEEMNLNKKIDEIWIVYAGTLGNSYDLETLLYAFKQLKEETKSNIKLHIIGNGPLENKLIKLNLVLNTNAIFYGRLPYLHMVTYLKKADIVVNPLKTNAPQSITNKHMDYSASGAPVVSSQMNEEYIRLIDQNKAGINCSSENSEELKNALLKLIEDPDLRKVMGQNHRRMGEKLFDREKIYSIYLSIFK
jgi:glycosyltransferase involved in cell wall biosynthesis